MTGKQRSRMVCVLVLLASACVDSAEPLFRNSVVSNDIDFIRSDDPSVEFETTRKGPARKEMPDKRSNTLFRDGVIVYALQYTDGATVEIWTSPDLVSEDAASAYAERVGEALGKLPVALRKTLSHAVVHGGDETAFAEEEGHFFVLYAENIDKRISTHDLEETVFHETIHATLEADHAKAPGWLAAQQDDPGYITEYAKEHPVKEDLPESALFAFALIHHPGRLPAPVEKSVREIMPNRLKYLRKLFDSLGVR